MKKFFFAFSVLFLMMSCGSSRSFQHFFDAHKTDIGVTAFQFPNFMKSILSNISPKEGMFNNLTDFKFITFNSMTAQNQMNLINEMNIVSSNKYTDMFRKNTVENTKIISVKELGNIVTEAIVFDSKLEKTTIFFIKGQFDPEKIKAFSDDNAFEEFSRKLQQEYQLNIKTKLNPSFNLNN